MTRKLTVFLLFLAFFAAIPAGAAMISVMVIETGLPLDNQANRNSIQWENGILDVYYEMGHIVSNTPIMRLTQIPCEGFPDEAERDYEEARETGMNYFVIAIINYPSPYKVSLRVFNTKSTQMLQELSYTDNPSLQEKDRYDRIKKVVMETKIR